MSSSWNWLKLIREADPDKNSGAAHPISHEIGDYYIMGNPSSFHAVRYEEPPVDGAIDLDTGEELPIPKPTHYKTLQAAFKATMDNPSWEVAINPAPLRDALAGFDDDEIVFLGITYGIPAKKNGKPCTAPAVVVYNQFIDKIAGVVTYEFNTANHDGVDTMISDLNDEALRVAKAYNNTDITTQIAIRELLGL